ncbi:sugar diacid recognition domain-containing protein [Bacillus tianshenii]|nr:sugar diacid recognition domain-containing protein [Bacillus tianshenii]
MQLFPALARQIVEEVREVITEQIIVVDRKGTIIASSDESRIGNFHEGALKALDLQKTVMIDEQLASQLKGVKPGITMPILFESGSMGVIGITGDPQVVEPFAELTRRMIELFVKEMHHSQQLEWQSRGVESYVYEWVNLKTVEDEFIERGEILGISMSSAYLVMLLQVDMRNGGHVDEAALRREMMEWFYRYFPRSKHDHLINWGRGRFVLLKNVERKVDRQFLLTHLKQWAKHVQTSFKLPLHVGIGKTIVPKVIGEGYHEAKKALKAAEKRKEIVFYEDLLLDLLLHDIPQQARNTFLKRTVDCLLGDDDLTETLRSYLVNNQSIKQTAGDLHIHLNTLHYRLKQIKERTGICPKTSEGIALFYLAFSLYDNVDSYKIS